MTTMGQALDITIKEHEDTYPGSQVYHAEVKGELKLGTGQLEFYRVELRASHFSCPMIHFVPIA